MGEPQRGGRDGGFVLVTVSGQAFRRSASGGEDNGRVSRSAKERGFARGQDDPPDLRLRARAAAAEPLPCAGGAGARALRCDPQRRHPQGLPPRGGPAGAGQGHEGLVQGQQRRHLRPASQRHGAARPRHRRRRADRQGHRAVRGVARDDRPGRQRPDAALRLGQARLRPGRSRRNTPICELRLPRSGRPTAWASRTFDRTRKPADGHDFWGAGPGDTSRMVHAAAKTSTAPICFRAIRSSRSSATSGSTRTTGAAFAESSEPAEVFPSTPTATSTLFRAPPMAYASPATRAT